MILYIQKTGKEVTNMKNYWTEETFGSYCPSNWEEICSFINALIDEGADEDSDLWEDFCEGKIEGCPEPIFE